MKTFTISAALALMATLAHAAPAPGSPDSAPREARQFQVQLTFEGAGPNPPTYTLSEPTDGSVFYINNPLSVSHISSLGGATCAIFGSEGSTTILVGAQTVDVGPPQPQVSGTCRAL